MDSSYNKNIVFLFLLLTTNLLTLFVSSVFYSSSCTLSFSTTATAAANATTFRLLPPEFLAFTQAQLLPLGFNRNFGSDTIHPPAGSGCALFSDELRKFMSYKVNGSCPDDELISQKLLLKGCEPLPRRRCRAVAPLKYSEPLPLPDSLWSTPSDSSVVWTAYTCKSYECLINRSKTQKGFDDCKDCFNLHGRERNRWTSPKSNGLHFSIDEVLGTRKPGTIRIGLDIGGGAATFAVRMRERNITIVTTSMNLNGPFNNFIASRGVVPLYLSISQRLPFFDNTLDIVHSMHVLSNWIPTTVLHFLLFDVYRVLRPGGLFWLDHFFCVEEEFKQVYKPLIQSIGFRKVKWVIGKKMDRGPGMKEMYLSALLEKPLNNSW
ncbi:hypothetical protein L6164_033069 [Bauhinia variegata]|uniref:Uncharacterized protein n=1 Tax=Bauhinia variegata TaxID=167791 RepID=A0ACB9KQP4_BAUVA|nr:hypothetical protein L6164_033069 [Bauhinia variegata]